MIDANESDNNQLVCCQLRLLFTNWFKTKQKFYAVIDAKESDDNQLLTVAALKS